MPEPIVDDLLSPLDGDFDDPSAGDPDADPGDPGNKPGGKKDQKPTDDANDRISKLEEDNKNLSETVRQLSETNKTLSEFHDRITGADKDKDKKTREQEIARKFDEDPVAATRELIQGELAEVKDGLNLIGQTGVVDRAMRKIDEQYEVDWDKDYEKIKTELARFSAKDKKDDPEGTLLRAAKLANVVKPRKPGDTPAGFPSQRRSGNPPRQRTETDDINKRLDRIGKKKKDNVFGI